MRTHQYVIAFYLSALLALAGPVGGYAQERLTLDPTKAITQYTHATWTTADGLPQNLIQAIEQTQDGYLWLGTQEGLVRFDGLHFTVFDRKNVDAFPVSNVQEVTEAPDGTLWIGLRGGGVVAYADGQFSGYTTADGLPSDYVTELLADDDGTLWVGTFEGGLARLQGGTTTVFGVDEGLTGRIISVLYRDPEGTLWAGTDVGLFSLEGDRFEPAPDARLASAYLTTYFVDRQGDRWVGTRDGHFWQFQGNTLVDHSERLTEPESYVRSVLEDAEGTLWLGVRGGGLLRYQKGTFSAFSQAEGLSHNTILALKEDREGSLWIGTTNGLDQLHDGKFTTYTTHEGLAYNKATSVHEDGTGAVWVATNGGGVSRLQNGRFTTYTTEDGLSTDNILTVNSDGSRAVWFGTHGSGLHRLHNGQFDHFTTADGLAGNEIYVLYTDQQGQLWIGTEGGVSRFDGTTFKNFTTEDGLTSPFVSALLEGRDGSMWIGTYDGGLTLLRNNQMVALTTEHGLASNAILSLHEDAQGTLWIGTYGEGISRFQNGQFSTITARDGLFDDTAAAILEDETGHLWITSNKGIFRVSRQEMNAFADGRLEQVTSTVYGVADGLKTSEANGGQQPAAWKDRQGHLWFPMNKGVAMIDPSHIRQNTVVPPVVIEEMFVDHRSVDLSEAIHLAPGSDKLAFQYVALSLVSSERMRYQVKLQGHDEAWNDMGERREAFYTNLDPGTYTFRVRAANNDGFWNEAGATATFILKPFFYQTIWFWALCAFGMLLVVFAGYHMRIRQLKARERELERVVDERTHDLRLEKERTEQAKEVIEAQAEKLIELDRFKTRFFANVSHEFRTPLTMIVGPLENALHNSYGPVGGPLRRNLGIMLRNALRLMRLINQLLDLSKLEAGKMSLSARPRNVVGFLEGVVLTCSALAEQKDLTLTFHSDCDEIELFYEPDKLEKVFFNLLSNALKYTPSGGKIEVFIAERPASEAMPEGAVEIRMRDTGRGIPETDLPYVFDRFRQVDGSNTREHEGTGIGLALVKELILLHKGTVDVESEVGVGSEFTLVLRKGSMHLDHEEVVIDQAEDEGFQPEHGPMLELAADLALTPEGKDVASAEDHPTSAPDEAPLVLLVDDNADVRDYISDILAETYRIAMARDGQEGFEQAQQLKPDLIISDVMMPRMDGNEFCRLIKADPELRITPVILLTARATHKLKIEGLEGGADDYMAKPFNAQELKARARNLIQLYQQERELRQLNAHLEEQVQEQVGVLMSERERYEQELIASKEKAEESARLKSAILDNMSHEFRTPISVILGYADIFATEAPEPLQEFATEIRQSGHRLMKTLEALMELSRLEAEDVGSHMQPIDLSHEVKDIVASFQSMADAKGLALHLQLPDPKPVPTHLDTAALQRIVGGLLDNALKFTNEGAVHVEVGQKDGHAYVRVQDTGIGIADPFLPQLYDAFKQESSGLTRSYDGSGLGLTIAKRLVDLMGGTISVETEQGEGSVFTVSFPEASQQDREVRPMGRSNSGKPFRIARAPESPSI